MVMVFAVIPGALARRRPPPDPAVVDDELVPFELPQPAATSRAITAVIR
jgi:hypothetical protein